MTILRWRLLIEKQAATFGFFRKMKDEEKDIIRLLNQRDKRAVAMLYDRYAASLYGIALQVVRSEPVAQDVIQEAFVKAWQNGSSYDFRKGTLVYRVFYKDG